MNTAIKPRSPLAALTQRSPWQVRVLAIVAAVVVNCIILAISRVINGEYPVASIGGDDQTIKFAQVIVVTLLVGSASWSLVNRLEWGFRNSAKTIWTAIALIVFAISLLGPLTSGVDTASKIILACMHIGAAATIIPLTRSTLAGHH